MKQRLSRDHRRTAPSIPSLSGTCGACLHLDSSSSPLSSSPFFSPSLPHSSPVVSSSSSSPCLSISFSSLSSSSSSSFSSLFSSPSSRSSSSSSPTLASSVTSISCQFLLLLVILALLHYPPLAKAKAVFGGEGRRRIFGDRDQAALSNNGLDLDSPFSSPCEDADDSVTRKAVIQEFKVKVLRHLGQSEPPSARAEHVHYFNGTRPEGRRVREYYRSLKRRKMLTEGAASPAATAGGRGAADLYGEGFPAEGSEEERLVFQSIESDVFLPVELRPTEAPQGDPVQVFTFKTHFRLPEKTYHDLVIKAAILRMRISRSRANLCRKLSALGVSLTANIFLVEHARNSSADDAASFTSSSPRYTLIGTATLRPAVEDFIAVKVDAGLISHIIDAGGSLVTVGLRVDAARVKKTHNFPLHASHARRHEGFKHKMRRLLRALSLLTSPSSSSWLSSERSGLQTAASRRRSFSSASAPLSPGARSASRKFLGAVGPPGRQRHHRGRQHHRASTRTSTVLLHISGASLELTVFTEDLRGPEAAESGRHGNGRSRRSTVGDRTCEEGVCCRKPLRVTFADIGFTDVLAPTYFEAYYCGGSCPERFKPANVFSQALATLHSKHPDRFPSPTCAPARMAPIEVLRLSDMGAQESIIPDMLVRSCHCV